MLEVLQELLEEAGHKVTCASDGEEGVRLFHQHPADLVVTDIVIPRKDGVEVNWDLRAHYPDVKILAMTGYDAGALPIAEQLGAVHTITKPFRNQDFMKAIENILG